MGSDLFITVEGIFYRAVDPAHLATSLAGSRAAGRHSSPAQPTLYLSATPEGVNAAMKAHRDARSAQLRTLRVEVFAQKVFDLRDADRRARAGISLEEATAPWQDRVAQGLRPSSWDVRDRLVALGAAGVIDPSRQSAGLWHLVLFAWNAQNAPTARLLD